MSNAATGNNRLTLTWPPVQTFRCYECKLEAEYRAARSQIRAVRFIYETKTFSPADCSRWEDNFPRAAAAAVTATDAIVVAVAAVSN